MHGIRTEVPGLEIGVRLSAFDFIPFKPDEDGIGIPEHQLPVTNYPYAFGGDGSGTGINLTRSRTSSSISARSVWTSNWSTSPQAVRIMSRTFNVPRCSRRRMDISRRKIRLVGVARLINATAELKAKHPNLCVVGTGYSYLQEWLPNVAQNVVRTGKADFVGLGRMVLTYPEMCADVLEGKPLATQTHLPHLQRLHHRPAQWHWSADAIRWTSSTKETGGAEAEAIEET